MRDVFKSAFVRKLGYMAAAAFVAVVLSFVGTGKAHAQTQGLNCGDTSLGWGWPPAPENQPICADQGEAYAMAKAAAHAYAKAMRPTTAPSAEALFAGPVCSGSPPDRYCYYVYHVTAGSSWKAYRWYPDGNTCSTRNASLGTNRKMRWATGSDETCIAGCKYKVASDANTRNIYANAPGQASVMTGRMFGGIWEYTGDTCTSTPGNEKTRDNENQKDPECVPAGSGRTYCIKTNGDHCNTATANRTICWTPGEEGTKTDGPITQTQNNGNSPPVAPEGSTHTNTTTTTNITNSTSTTTTINNYSTNNGGAAGGSNQGEGTGSNGAPGGGSGAPGGSGTGSGGDDDEGNGSSGGGTCAQPPVGTGDQALAQIAKQAWETRCVIEKRNKDQDESAAGMDTDDGLSGIEESDIWADEEGDPPQIVETLLGGGGGSCQIAPQMSLFGKEIPIPPNWWELASWIGFLTVASAYLWVVQMLGK